MKSIFNGVYNNECANLMFERITSDSNFVYSNNF